MGKRKAAGPIREGNKYDLHHWNNKEKEQDGANSERRKTWTRRQ